MNNIKTNAIMLRIIESQYIASKNTDAVFNADAEVKYNGVFTIKRFVSPYGGLKILVKIRRRFFQTKTALENKR